MGTQAVVAARPVRGCPERARWTAALGPGHASPTHDLGGRGGADNDGEVGRDEGHARLHVLVDAVLGGVELQGHVACLLQPLQLLRRQLLTVGERGVLGRGHSMRDPASPPWDTVKTLLPHSTTTPAHLWAPNLSLPRASPTLSPTYTPLESAPLRGGGGDADHHDGGVGKDLLQVLVVLTLVQAVPQLLWEKEKSCASTCIHLHEHIDTHMITAHGLTHTGTCHTLTLCSPRAHTVYSHTLYVLIHATTQCIHTYA